MTHAQGAPHNAASKKEENAMPKQTVKQVNDLAKRCIEKYGKVGWKQKLGADIGKDYATIKRWFNQYRPIDKAYLIAIESVLKDG